MTEQQPTIGRIVHYTSFEKQPQPNAAIITAISGLPTLDPPEVEAVSLSVLHPTGMVFIHAIPFSAEPKPGHWSWPPRV